MADLVKLTRLLFDQDETNAAFDVRFPHDLSLVSLDSRSVARCRAALNDLLHGTTDFGRTFIEIDGIEIEANQELASHFSSRLAGRNELVKSQGTTPQESTYARSSAVALRCALELSGVLPSQLGRRDLEEALDVVIAERHVILDDAKAAVERATDAVAMASESLVRLDRWLTIVEPTRSRLGHALRKLQTPRESSASEELEASVLSRELEISRPAGFAGCRDFPTFAATARRERSEIATAAAVELDEALRHLEEVTDGTSSWVHARQQMIHEDLLQRGLAHIDHDDQENHNDPPEAEAEDVRAATQAIESLLELRDDDFPIASDDALHQAATWLGKIEGDSLRDELERQAIIHTDPVAVLGTIPLILDRPGEGMTADAIWHALSVLDRYVGRFQIIVLDPAIEVQRWAASLGFDRSGAAASSKSGNT